MYMANQKLRGAIRRRKRVEEKSEEKAEEFVEEAAPPQADDAEDVPYFGG